MNHTHKHFLPWPRLALLGVLLVSLSVMPGVQANANWVDLINVSAISMEHAVSLVKKNKGNRVLSAVTYSVNGKTEYHIKVLTKGRVRTIRIEAQTGEPINRPARNLSNNAYPNNRR